MIHIQVGCNKMPLVKRPACNKFNLLLEPCRASPGWYLQVALSAAPARSARQAEVADGVVRCDLSRFE